MSLTTQLLDKYPIISDQIKRPALETVLGELERVLAAGVPGDAVEFGCYIGTTSLFIRRLLDAYEGGGTSPNSDDTNSSGKVFHAYDSFAGLPPKTTADNSPVGDDFKAGELAVSKKQYMEQFHRAGLRAPVTHKGWFKDLTAHDVPEQISFAFLDGDFYESILDSLKLVWPWMQPGGGICIDDCGREALPGVDRAVRDFFTQHAGRGQGAKTLESLRLSHNIGIIKR